MGVQKGHSKHFQSSGKMKINPWPPRGNSFLSHFPFLSSLQACLDLQPGHFGTKGFPMKPEATREVSWDFLPPKSYSLAFPPKEPTTCQPLRPAVDNTRDAAWCILAGHFLQ